MSGALMVGEIPAVTTVGAVGFRKDPAAWQFDQVGAEKANTSIRKRHIAVSSKPN
jgi:hypothetical protein